MALAKKVYYDQFNLFHHMCMIEYEKTCLSEYTNGKESGYVFNQPNNQKLTLTVQKLKESTGKESLETIHEFIKAESYEIDAFLEAISMREKYDQYKVKTQEKQKSETSDLQKNYWRKIHN